MDTRVIIVIIVVLVVVLLVVFWPFGPKSSSSHKTTYVPPSNTQNQSGPTTTIVPARIEFYAINYQWVYNGPSSQNGNQCYYYTHTLYTIQTEILNGSEVFDLVLAPSTNSCGIRINSINSSTPGFTVTSTQPALPFLLPEYSQAEMQINMQAPDVDFYGPLTITIHYS